MIGNDASRLEHILFVLDESLTPPVAEALRLVGYNFTTTTALLGYEGAKDPTIIHELSARGAVCVHADDSAKRTHRKIILAEGIRTLWVYRRKGKMSAQDQLRILSYLLPRLREEYGRPRCPRHFKMDSHGLPPRTRLRLKPYEL